MFKLLRRWPASATTIVSTRNFSSVSSRLNLL
jgi:hypothetical protein